MTADEVVSTFRRWRSLSTRDLAAESGVPETTIRRIESGQEPRLSALVSILDALEVDPKTRATLVGAA